MARFFKYLSYAIVGLYFFLGVFILASPYFSYLTLEIKIIFSAFLFLYGGYRVARIWSRRREERED